MIRAYMGMRARLQGRTREAAGAGLREAREASVLVGGVGGRFDHALAAIEPIRGDAMAQVRLAGLRINRQRGLGRWRVRAVHSALGGSLATLLDWHGTSPSKQCLERPASSSPRLANGRCTSGAASSRVSGRAA